MMGTDFMGNDGCQNVQHSLVLSAFFPTTWMSGEVLLPAHSVWRIQHEDMLCLSFSITTQLVFLNNEIVLFFNTCFIQLTAVQQLVFFSYVSVDIMQFTSMSC